MIPIWAERRGPPSHPPPKKIIYIRKKPIPITVTKIKNIIDFNNDMSSGDEFIYESKLVFSRYIRIFPASFRDKVSFHEHRKQSNIQQYLVSDSENLIKVLIIVLSGFAEQQWF